MDWPRGAGVGRDLLDDLGRRPHRFERYPIEWAFVVGPLVGAILFSIAVSIGAVDSWVVRMIVWGMR